MSFPDTRRFLRLTDAPKMLGVAAFYALLIYVEHRFFQGGTTFGPFEVSSGFALAVLLIGGKRYVWGVFLGGILINATINPLGAAVAISSGDAVEALGGAWLLMRDQRFDPAIRSLRDYLRLFLLGGVVAVGIVALTVVTVLFLTGFITSEFYFQELMDWWMGDVLGIILATPLILVFSQTKNDWLGLRRVAEAVLLLGLTFLAGQIIFLGWFHNAVNLLQLLAQGYWMFLFIALVAYRLGSRGTVIAINLVAIQALAGAYQGTGFFANDIVRTQLLSYWCYTAILSVIGMALATHFSERKLTEEALLTNVASLRAILNNSPYLVWFKDVEGHYVKVNKTYVDYARLTDEKQIIGKTDFELWPPELAEKYRAGDVEAMASRQQQHAEELSFDGDKAHWVETFKTPVIDEEGNVLGTTGFAHDITERKHNEAKIDYLSRTYRLLSRVDEAIVRVQCKSELFTAICNAAIESALFRFVWIGMLDEKRSAVIPVAYAGDETGYLGKFNIRLDDEGSLRDPTTNAILTNAHVVCQDIAHDASMAIWRDEAIKRGYFSAGMFPIQGVDSVVGTINVYAGTAHFFSPDIIQLMLELASDISFSLSVFAEKERRKLAEDEIRQLNVDLEHRIVERTHQLELVNRELEAFSYSVSHDLRAPLRSIDGFSQIVMKKHQDQLDESGKDYLARVSRASQRMGRLIDDLLRLSQVTRGILDREEVDLSKIAENVADELRKINPERVVRFTIQPGLLVHADVGLLRIVLDNLLGNAYKYTSNKAVAEIEFGMCGNQGKRIFFVRDNGAGFNMDYAHKLFGAFQRLHGANEFEGSGIGLATVQRIIHRHHGKVWAEAKEGLGATFYFTLPQRERKASEDA